MQFESNGLGRANGDKPAFVLTHRALSCVRETVEFCSGNHAQLVNGRLRQALSERHGGLRYEVRR